MPLFVVRYFDPARSAVLEETAQADSEAVLRTAWSNAERIVLSLRRETAGLAKPARGAARFDIGDWCRELATLLRAGMSVVEALETLHAQAGPGLREQIYAQLLRSLQEGQSLSRAMRTAGRFPLVLVASVTASERTSTLTSALEEFVRYDEMLRRLRRQAVSAAIYPAVVMSFGFLVALFLLLYVIPRFSRMYVDFHGAVSLPTQLLIGVSRLLHDRMPAVVGTLAVIAVTLLWAWRAGHVTAFAARALDRLPPLQKQLDHFERAKLYQSLALMFKGGYTLDEALAVCEDMGLRPGTSSRIAHARGELARGRSVVTAFESSDLSDPVATRLLAVGERGGSFDLVLQTIADRHASSFATFVERATRIVEPLLLMVVALVVGGIVVMMYMPIFDIANGVR